MSDSGRGFGDRVSAALVWLWWGGGKPGPSWLLMFGIAMGFIIGVLFVWCFGQVEVIEKVRTYIFGEKSLELPKPVTPPPPGMAWVKVLTTGYCPCFICCEKKVQDHKTAINRDIRTYPYGIASDHKMVPARINLMVPGYGYAMVDDTGGAMRQSAKRGIVHLDLRYEDHQVARKWGRRWMWIALPADSAAARLPPEPER